MKICFISFEYPPFVIGGAGVYAKCLCRELAKLGHEVHVISPGTGSSIADSIENGVFVHRIPILNKSFLKIPSYWLRLRKYYKVLEEELAGLDLLHGNVSSDFSLTKDLVKVPRVVTIHHLARTAFEATRPSFLEKLLNLRGELGLVSWIEKKLIDFDKRVIDRADKIIVVSKFVKHSLASTYKVSALRIKVVYDGIYPEDYKCSKDEVWEIKNQLGLIHEPIILFVGRLESRKGLSLLLKAFKFILKQKKSKLIIAGYGEQKPFRRLASSLGIDKQVIFTGFVDDVTLKKLYNACDLFVLPSLLEGLGITLLEAMAAGKPIVASNVGGIPEVIKNGVHGKLVDPRRTEELAKALVFFTENPQLAKEIGEQNKRYVIESFSWKKAAKLTEELYKSLI